MIFKVGDLVSYENPERGLRMGRIKEIREEFGTTNIWANWQQAKDFSEESLSRTFLNIPNKALKHVEPPELQYDPKQQPDEEDDI